MEAILSSWNVCTYLLSLKWCHISLISRLFLISSYLSHFSISACIQQYWFLKKSFQLSLCLDISWQFRILRLEKEFQSPPTWSSKRPASGTDASAPHTPTLSCRNPSTTRRSATFLCWTFLFSFEVFSEKKEHFRRDLLTEYLHTCRSLSSFSFRDRQFVACCLFRPFLRTCDDLVSKKVKKSFLMCQKR